MKTIRALLAIFLLVAGIYAGYKIVPVYINNYQLQDALDEEVKLNTYTLKSENDMRQSIYKKAQSLDIPVTPEQIEVKRAGNTVSISTQYTMHVDLPLYPLDLTFAPSSKNKSVI
ncbi:MAG TPA: DUF4845 domain-containing protein [Terriglobales bacterium]|nr:DUF4845 domain-containing protein [Terriglobales bacterium]